MYDFLIIDSYNLAYKIFHTTKPHILATVSDKLVFLSFVKKYMEYVDLLKDRFGNSGCKVYNLFDNPTSRNNLKHITTQYSTPRIRYELDPEYKANRNKESKEFYNSVQFIKFLFSIKGPDYFTVRVPNLEADDLVKPIISENCGKGKTLMVSTDMDWCRFLTPFVHVLTGGVNDPVTDINKFTEDYGFHPTEEKIILYKLLFGDRIDNIRPVFPGIPKQVKQKIMQTCRSVHDLYSFRLQDFKEYKDILDKHTKDMRIAYQLLSVIPMEKGKIQSFTVKGRNALRLQEMVNRVFEQFEENKPPAKFSFGKLKCPRY